ncbi:MAG: pentapeptide repeat-containing protein [Pyrinomonadaceae bacterium]
MLRRKNKTFIEELELDEYGEVPEKPSIDWKRIMIGLLWISLTPFLILLTYFVHKAPQLMIADNALKLTNNEWLQRVNEARATVVQAIGGLVLLVGIFFTWRNIRATEKNLKISQQATAKNLEISQEGLVTQRFSKAIELLGSDKVQVRLGGIYALERIARESKKDHWPIMEILTGFVRENSPRVRSELPKLIGTDVQAILTVIGRRNKQHEIIGMRRNLSESRSLDFHGTNLHGADLHGANLSGALLSDVDLTSSNMLGTNLEHAYLDDCDLSYSKIIDSNLRGTDLNGSQFRQASLYSVKFDPTAGDRNGKKPTSFFQADIKVCSFRKTNLIASDFRGAKFLGGSLDGAVLKGAYLTGASFEVINLKEVDLTEVKGLTLEQINKEGVEFDPAKLSPEIRNLLERDVTTNRM